MKYIFTVILLLLLACGSTESTPDRYVQYTGIIEVVAPGTRSETVLLEDFNSGERFALVGDIARELAQQYGMSVTVTAIPTEEGWSIRPELQKLKVIEYALITPERDIND